MMQKDLENVTCKEVSVPLLVGPSTCLESFSITTTDATDESSSASFRRLVL